MKFDPSDATTSGAEPVVATGATSEAIRTIADRVGRLSVDIARVSGDVLDVSSLADLQRDRFRVIRTRMHDMSRRSGDVITAANEALENSGKAQTQADQTTANVAQAMQAVARLTEQVNEISSHLGRVVESLERVARVSNHVRGIARQTNMLSLNASIEAARAGVHGRGFMIVAGEVKKLSNEASIATDQIGETIDELTREVQIVIAQTDAASALSLSIRDLTDRVDNDIATIPGAIADVRQAQTHIVEVAGGIGADITTTETDVDKMTKDVEQQALSLTQASAALLTVTDHAEALTGITARLGVETVDTPFIAAVTEKAAMISKLFEDAVAAGRVSMPDLFDETYVKIPGSTPVQHMTRFTRFADQLLPLVQEPMLALSPSVVFCAAIDRNGYIPTHNLKFSQPQRPGETEWNTKHARNRRIFNDRVGLGAGRSTRPFLLQAYRRDMGDGEFRMMKDVSAPIMVHGRHWGGLRLAYLND